jgi:hypothetical protein
VTDPDLLAALAAEDAAPVTAGDDLDPDLLDALLAAEDLGDNLLAAVAREDALPDADLLDDLRGMASDARDLRDRARALDRRRPGRPGPVALAEQAGSLALAAEWFARESPGTIRHATPLVSARLRALTNRLETTL